MSRISRPRRRKIRSTARANRRKSDAATLRSNAAATAAADEVRGATIRRRGIFLFASTTTTAAVIFSSVQLLLVLLFSSRGVSAFGLFGTMLGKDGPTFSKPIVQRERKGSCGSSTASLYVATTTTSSSSSSSSTSTESSADSRSSSSDGATASSSSPRRSTTVGNWEELHGNFLLRPSVETGAPRALVHFLGGAMVGASPHVSYRYFLECLAAKGYLVVATPYSLSFDHLSTCDAVIGRFERIAPLLARTYGALPVVGVGHSLGALLQVLITSIFPDTPRAANALISYNNKPVNEAVPFFEEVVVPFFTYAAARNDTTRNSSSEIISVGLSLAKAGAAGEVPSDELLSRALQLLTPPGGGLASATNDKSNIAVPDAVRNMFSSLTSPLASVASTTGALPVMTEALETLEQVPLLMDEVADGARDFNPTPEKVKAAARRAYRARRTMVLKYTDDPIDESDEIEELLTAAQQIIRMKRPMVQIDVQRSDLAGRHAALLQAPPLDIATRAETILGADVAKERLLYAAAAESVEEISRWLEESNL